MIIAVRHPYQCQMSNSGQMYHEGCPSAHIIQIRSIIQSIKTLFKFSFSHFSQKFRFITKSKVKSLPTLLHVKKTQSNSSSSV